MWRLRGGSRELGVTQSTISRRIATLEAKLGVRLIERTTRHVALTDAGLSYASELHDILLRLRDADARAQRGTAEPEGLIRITMPTALGRASVVPALARVSRRYPKLRFELDLSDRYVDLSEGTYDIAVRTSTTPQSGIREERIASFGRCLCASPDYLETHGTITELSQLGAHDCLALRTYAPRTTWQVIWRGEPAELRFYAQNDRQRCVRASRPLWLGTRGGRVAYVCRQCADSDGQPGQCRAGPFI